MDKSRIARALHKPKLRRAEFQRLRLFANLPGWFEQGIDVIPYVEELSAEFEAHLVPHWKHLEYGQIPVLEARAADDVASGIAKRERNRIVDEGARIENRAGQAWLTVLISHNVWSNFKKSHATAAIAGRYVGRSVGDGEPVSGGSGGDFGDLPIPNDLIFQAGRIAAESFSVTKRKLINVADHKTVTNVEIGIAVFKKWKPLIAKVAVIQRA